MTVALGGSPYEIKSVEAKDLPLRPSESGIIGRDGSFSIAAAAADMPDSQGLTNEPVEIYVPKQSKRVSILRPKFDLAGRLLGDLDALVLFKVKNERDAKEREPEQWELPLIVENLATSPAYSSSADARAPLRYVSVGACGNITPQHLNAPSRASTSKR